VGEEGRRSTRREKKNADAGLGGEGEWGGGEEGRGERGGRIFRGRGRRKGGGEG